jgi:hypothetical protein
MLCVQSRVSKEIPSLERVCTPPYSIGFPFLQWPEIPQTNWNLVLHFQQQELVLLADAGPHLLTCTYLSCGPQYLIGTSRYAWLPFGVSCQNISTVHAGSLVKYLSRRATRQTLSAAQKLQRGKRCGMPPRQRVLHKGCKRAQPLRIVAND